MNTQKAFEYLSNIMSDFFIADMNRLRADCMVRDYAGETFAEALEEAKHYAMHDAERIADICVALAYRHGGASEVVSLAEAVSTLNEDHETMVAVDDCKVVACDAVMHMLALYDIDTNVTCVLRHAEKAYSQYIENIGEKASDYLGYISDLLDNEGGTISDLMEREPFDVWFRAHAQ